MSQQPQPQWQPISQLALITSHIDGMLEAAQGQYQTLQPVRSKPHVLNTFTVGRMIEVFTIQKNDLLLFDGQLQRRTAQSLTPQQCQSGGAATHEADGAAMVGHHQYLSTRRQSEGGDYRTRSWHKRYGTWQIIATQQRKQKTLIVFGSN